MMSLAGIVTALSQPGCKVCTCTVPPETPGSATAVERASSGRRGRRAAATSRGACPTLEERRHPGRRLRQRHRLQPDPKGLVFARTDVGGAYRFDSDRKSWIPLTDQLGRDSNFFGIESLAADPVDANKVYLAAGTYTGLWVGNGAILRSTIAARPGRPSTCR